MPHQVVLWWGYPVRKEKFVGRIANRNYWWVTFLTPSKTYTMVVLP